jgi:D-xylose transport system substrate-binding protein
MSTSGIMSRRAVVLLAGLALVAGACQGGATSAPSGSAVAGGGGGSGASGKVALLLPNKDASRYEAADKPYFEQKLKEVCPNLEVLYSNANADSAAQQSQAEAVLASGVKVLVLDSVDGAAAKSAVAGAIAKGVPVVSYDRLSEGDIDYYVSFDNFTDGVVQAKTLMAKLAADGHPNGPIVMINGSPQDPSATAYKAGAHSVFDGKVTIAKEAATPNWKPEEAQTIMDQDITALGKDGFVGVYAAADGVAGAAITSMINAGIDPKTRPITGQDGELQAIQRILDGTQYMTAYNPIKVEADASAEIACDLASGTPVPSSLTGGVTVKNDTKDVPSVLIKPMAVTRDGKAEGTISVNDSVIADGFTDPKALCTGNWAKDCTELGIKY